MNREQGLCSLRMVFTVIVVMTVVSLAGAGGVNTYIIGGSDEDTASVSFDPDSTLLLSASVKGFDPESTSLFYVYGRFSGSGEISISLDSLSDSDDRAEAGLMLRSDTASGAPFLSLSFSLESGLLIRYRTSPDQAVSTVPVNDRDITGLKIQRSGDVFDFYYKTEGSNGFRNLNSTYTIEFDYNMYAGIFLSSQGRDNTAEGRISDVEGFSVFKSEEQDTSCNQLLYDFNSDTMLSDMGFVSNGMWEIRDSSVRSVPDSVEAVMHTPEFTVIRETRPASFKWSMNTQEDSGASEQHSASLYAVNGIEVGDRAEITGEVISSDSDITIGTDSYIESSVESKGSVGLGDRTSVLRSVRAGGSVVLGSQVSVLGDIESGADVNTPDIETRSINTGTSDITVNNYDTLHVQPGSYDEFLCRSNSVAVFESGVYSFRTFVCEPDVDIVFSDTVSSKSVINTEADFSLSDRCRFLFMDAMGPSDVEVYSNQTADMRIGTDAVLGGALYAPHARVLFSSRGVDIEGRVYADRIRIEPDVDLCVTMPVTDDRYAADFVMKSGPEGSESYKFKIHNRPESQDSLVSISILKSDTLLKDSLFDPGILSSGWTEMEAEFNSGTNDTAPYEITLYAEKGGLRERLISVIDSSIIEFSRGSFVFSGGDSSGYESGSLFIDDISFSCIGGGCDSIAFTIQPQDADLYEGSDVLFHAEALNADFYQWYRSDGSLLEGENSQYLNIRDVSASQDSGKEFFCAGINSCDTLFSDTAILSVHECGPPVILTQPQDVIAPVGGTAVFTVSVEGYDLNYRWLINNQVAETGESDTLLHTGLKEYNTGDMIRVLVSNPCGWTVTSDPAELSVSGDAECGIIRDPEGDTLESGEYFIAEITTDCGEAAYTWLRNGEEVEAGDESELLFGPVDTTCSGDSFVCVIDNGTLTDTSSAAYIHVNPKKRSHRLISVSGLLKRGTGIKEARDDTAAVEFSVILYNRSKGGDSVYTEEFTGRKRIVVEDGEFTLQLGRGESWKNLQRVIASNNHLFAEVRAGKGREVIGPRIHLSGVPYSMSEGRRVIYGTGSPGEDEQSLPESTLYVDRDSGNTTWIKTQDTWVRLD